jgi:hypothetical protein
LNKRESYGERAEPLSAPDVEDAIRQQQSTEALFPPRDHRLAPAVSYSIGSQAPLSDEVADPLQQQTDDAENKRQFAQRGFGDFLSTEPDDRKNLLGRIEEEASPDQLRQFHIACGLIVKKAEILAKYPLTMYYSRQLERHREKVQKSIKEYLEKNGDIDNFLRSVRNTKNWYTNLVQLKVAEEGPK